MPAPYGDGLYAVEPPPGNGLNITDTFHIVAPKPDDPGINSRVDSKYTNVAIITFDDTNEFGGMWAKEQLDLTMPFSTEMYLHLGHQFGKTGTVADGMTFTLHNDAAGFDAIGGAGEGLGVYKGRKWDGTYYQGNPVTVPHGTYLRNALVVEFDTYRNRFAQQAFVDDPAGGTAHCSLIIPGADTITVENHNNNIFFAPEQRWVRFEVSWAPNGSGGGMLSYDFDGNKGSYLVLNVMATFKSTKVYWGFTGATGQGTAVQAAAITRLPKQGITVRKMVKNAAGEDIDHGSVLPGDVLTYTIRVTALTLTDPVGPVFIEDIVSDLVEYVNASVRVTTSSGGAYAGQSTYTGHTLSINSTQYLYNDGDWIDITFNVKVNNNTAGKTVYNQATVNGAGLAEEIDTNITDVSVFAEPEKWVSESSEAGKDGGEVRAGDRITYEIEYANSTGAPAGIIITDMLHSGLDYVQASNGGAYDSGSRTVTWKFQDVEDGFIGTVLLVATVNENTVIRVENHATVTVDGTPQDTNTVVNPVAPENPVKKVADISEAGKSGSTVKIGDRITYEISYLNYTGDEAGIVIVDKLPSGVDYMSSNPEGEYDEDTRTVKWTLPNVASAVRGAVTVQVRVNVKAAMQVINYATVQVGNAGTKNTNIVISPISGFRCANIKQATKCRTTVRGRKIWEDNDNAGGKRPPVVEIILLRDGEFHQSASISSTGDGAYAFTCLPIRKNSRQKYEYKIDEKTVPDGYIKTIDGYNIKNTFI